MEAQISILCRGELADVEGTGTGGDDPFRSALFRPLFNITAWGTLTDKLHSNMIEASFEYDRCSEDI